MAPGTDLVPALESLRDRVAATPLALELGGAPAQRALRDALVQQADDYLLPRLRSLDAPLLAVVGGSTGAGKSTLVNSLLGVEVTQAGVLRPTTRSPVLICHPHDRPRFADDRVLPQLARTTGDGPGGLGTLRLVTSEALPPGLALLDAPDIDSVVRSNRRLAVELLAAADLWIFVTTAARYADAVPWDLLADAGERDVAVAIVLDRVPPGAAVEIEPDLRRMLSDHHVDVALVHAVTESPLVDGRLPEDEVAPLRSWLLDLGRDTDARAAVVRRTLQGALDDVERRVGQLVQAGADQAAVLEGLREQVASAYRTGREEIDEGVRSGALLRGEVLARWQEVVGTGELMRTVQARVSWARDRLLAAVTGRATGAGVEEAVESGVAALVHAAVDGSAEEAVARWRREPAGRALVAGRAAELGRASAATLARIPEEIRAWQSDVLELVRTEGEGKRTGARIASYTLNAASLAVMLAVFASTAGLTGAELAIAGGSSVAGQKLLEAVFGDQAIRGLAERARGDLLDRVDVLLAADAARFEALLPAAEGVPDLAASLAAWRAARRGSADADADARSLA